MKQAKTVISLLFVCVAMLGVTNATVSSGDIRVYLDGNELSYQGAKPVYREADKTVYLPLRDTATALGAEVSYLSDSDSVQVKHGASVAVLPVGSAQATVNGVKVPLSAASRTIDGSTYAPLDFWSAAFFTDAEWKAETRTVRLTARRQAELGQTAEDVKALYGEPGRTDTSEKGYTWNVYNADYLHFTQVGLADGKVVAYYLGGAEWTLPDGLRSGMTPDAAAALLQADGYAGAEARGYAVYTGKSDSVTVFYGNAADCTVYAVLVEDSAYAGLSRVTSSVLQSFAQELGDLVNAERAKRKLEPLSWNDTVAQAAKAHASDMAKNNFFSHEGSDGRKPSDRLTEAGLSDFYQLEAISKAFPNSFCSFAGHVGLAEYEAVLDANYKEFGAGVAYNPKSDGILYYAQVFYAPKGS